MLVNIGFSNIINSDKIVAIVTPDSSPAKRLIASAKANGSIVDATSGRKTRSVIVTDTHIVLSANTPDTIASRC